MIKLASLRGGLLLLSLLATGCATNPSGQADGSTDTTAASSDAKVCRLMKQPGDTLASMACKTKAEWAAIDAGPAAGAGSYDSRKPQRRSAFDALDQQGKR